MNTSLLGVSAHGVAHARAHPPYLKLLPSRICRNRYGGLELRNFALVRCLLPPDLRNLLLQLGNTLTTRQWRSQSSQSASIQRGSGRKDGWAMYSSNAWRWIASWRKGEDDKGVSLGALSPNGLLSLGRRPLARCFLLPHQFTLPKGEAPNPATILARGLRIKGEMGVNNS
jgi:hypothetical protein